MTTIRKIVTSKVDGNSADTNDTNEIRPFGEIAVYLNTEPNPDKLTLMMFDGTRTHMKSMVLAPGRLYGSDADSGDGNGRDTIKLIPDASLSDYTGNDQYLIIDPTSGEPGHIHIRAGGIQDQSTADLYLGAEQTFVRVSDTTDNVVIRTSTLGEGVTPHTWTFDNTGDLTLPNNAVIRTDGSNVEVGNVTNFNVEASGVVNIYTDTNGETPFQWQFSADGSLTIPGDIRSEGNINIDINLSDSTLQRWQFGEDGELTLPDGSVFTGTGSIGFKNNSIYDLAGMIISNSNQTTFPTAEITIPSNASGSAVVITNNLKGWAFENDGSLTVPGDIQSDSDISVRINRGDSTQRVWRFGNDGDLTLPGNFVKLEIDEANPSGGLVVSVDAGVPGYESKSLYKFGRSGQFTSRAISVTDANGVRVGGLTGDSYGPILGSTTDKEVWVSTDGQHLWRFTADRDFVLPYGGGNIRSEGNINIDINLSDSTLRRWQFGEDGDLIVPGSIQNGNSKLEFNTGGATNLTLAVGDLSWRIDSDGFLHAPNQRFIRFYDEQGAINGAIGGDNLDHVVFGAGENKGIKVFTDDATNLWIFGTDGSLTFPGGMTIETEYGGAPTLVVDGKEHTVEIRADEYILIGYNNSSGNVYIGNQTSGQVDIVSNKFRVLAPAPSSSTGAVGDQLGQVAFNGSYIYYCTADYTNGASNIWKRVAWSGDTW
jgi:hypothetical protein